jgi:hypothetical protein
MSAIKPDVRCCDVEKGPINLYYVFDGALFPGGDFFRGMKSAKQDLPQRGGLFDVIAGYPPFAVLVQHGGNGLD